MSASTKFRRTKCPWKCVIFSTFLQQNKVVSANTNTNHGQSVTVTETLCLSQTFHICHIYFISKCMWFWSTFVHEIWVCPQAALALLATVAQLNICITQKKTLKYVGVDLLYFDPRTCPVCPLPDLQAWILNQVLPKVRWRLLLCMSSETKLGLMV